MDSWKYYGITHRDHGIMNPLSSEALDRVLDLAAIPQGASVLDIGCGKGELLLRLARRGAGACIGVEASPYTAAEARERAGSEPRITLVEQDAATYTAPEGSYDFTACVGASWIFSGHRGTLRALSAWTRPGGIVLVGEPFWRTSPDPRYLALQSLTEEQFGTHASNAADGRDAGLLLLYATAASGSDWDWYEGQQWRAAEEWSRENPEDSDVPELLRMVRENSDAYLKWGRDSLGFALYLFRKPV